MVMDRLWISCSTVSSPVLGPPLRGLFVATSQLVESNISRALNSRNDCNHHKEVLRWINSEVCGHIGQFDRPLLFFYASQTRRNAHKADRRLPLRRSAFTHNITHALPCFCIFRTKFEELAVSPAHRFPGCFVLFQSFPTEERWVSLIWPTIDHASF